VNEAGRAESIGAFDQKKAQAACGDNFRDDRLIWGGYAAMSETKEQAHWRKTTNLMLTHLGIWFFFGYIIHMFVNVLNKVTIPILGFPLGFYMAAQGALIVFVVQLFLFARQQNKIDHEFGFAEDEE
jgi:putative solute:sodium symporter small subunit